MGNSEEFKTPDFQKIKNLIDASVNEKNEDDYLLLDLIRNIHQKIQETIISKPSLHLLFKDEFGSFVLFSNEDHLLELIASGEYLFTDTKRYPLYAGEELNTNIFDSYEVVINEWLEKTISGHNEMMSWIENDFDLERSYKSLPCNCTECIAEYRTKYRYLIFSECLENVTKLYDEILEKKESLSYEQASDKISKTKKFNDKLIQKSKNKLRKSSLKKLEKQVGRKFLDLFGLGSEVFNFYSKVIKEELLQELEKDQVSRELISEKEFNKVFNSLGLYFWRGKNYLRREFKKFAKSILILKREDVSSSILEEYLGKFWEHSISRTLTRKIIYHMGPTNSGKTYNAIQALSKSEKGCYLAPLRLLAGEMYDTLNELGVKTTLLTGEEVINVEGATHYSSTIEMARLLEEFDCVVIDEIQMISDTQRGWAWTRALVNIFSPEIHLCGDGSVIDLIRKIVEITGDELEIRNYERKTKLNVLPKPLKLGDLEKHDALVVFSRRNALKYKYEIENLGFKVSIIYGRLSPEVRREQARKFDEGETDVIVSTDAIAMGMNLPIRRIIFSTLSKFIDGEELIISDSEIKQIAGRAGRYKRFDTGFVTCLSRVAEGIDTIKSAIEDELEQKKLAMVGPDLEIYYSVNEALQKHGLQVFKLSEFLRLFYTIEFSDPFFCVELKEMIEVAEIVEEADKENRLEFSEQFGFTCAPVNLGLNVHVEHFVWILKNYVQGNPIPFTPTDSNSNDIDYLETSIKCTELYQWLSRHFNDKNFDYDEDDILTNKSDAVAKLNTLLSKKVVRQCSSCGTQLQGEHKFNICEECFGKRKRSRRRNDKSFSKSKMSDKKRSFKKKSWSKKKKNKR